MFVGVNKLVLYNLYSREDVGLKGTLTAGIKVNGNEVILFVNLGVKYDNRLTTNGLIHQPRLKKDIFTKSQAVIFYLFIRQGNKGDYYYVGISRNQAKYNNTYNMLDFNASGIPANIIHQLGGFQKNP